LNLHDKGSDKLKNLEHFEVGEHPDHPKTRCFFVSRKDGSKEDFSISKCITNLEKR
jgi:DNA-directed RNA polymerase-4 subunit 1